MSRHLIIRCDAPGCAERIETHAPDDAPISIEVPGGWLTLRQDGRRDRHYCSLACLHANATSNGGTVVTTLATPAEPPETYPIVTQREDGKLLGGTARKRQ